jgi:hypothetical protein
MRTMVQREIFDLQGVELIVRKLRGSNIKVLADETERVAFSVRLSQDLADIIDGYVEKTGFSKNVLANLLLWGGVQLVTAQMENLDAQQEEEEIDIIREMGGK